MQRPPQQKDKADGEEDRPANVRAESGADKRFESLARGGADTRAGQYAAEEVVCGDDCDGTQVGMRRGRGRAEEVVVVAREPGLGLTEPVADGVRDELRNAHDAREERLGLMPVAAEGLEDGR